MARVVVLGGLHPEGMIEIEERLDLDCVQYDGTEGLDIARLIRDAEGVLVRTQVLTAEALDGAKDLKVVSRHGVGYDSVDVEALSRRGIPLALTVNTNHTTVAEQAMALLLALAKHVRPYDRAVRACDWDVRQDLEAWEIDGRTMLLVGCGRAGRALCERALAFGMRVLALDPYADPPPGAESVDSLEAGLRQADVVSLHAPLTEDTRHLMDAAAFAAMKPGAVLVNTARGGLVDEAALLHALEKGTLAGAGLDTFETEPSPPDHPLYGRDDVILSPHVAGVSSESLRRMGVESARNLIAGMDGTLAADKLANPEVLGPRRDGS